MNDADRELWVSNDESLYRWQKSTRLSLREFVRRNRGTIDAAINVALHPRRA